MDSSRLISLPEGLRVLLVDDDSASLTVLEESLKKCKYEVTCTSSAEEAVKMLGERKDWFEIVMCDVKEDVFMFVEHVRKLDIPVIMMTCDDGDTNTRVMMRSLVAGACDHLFKPLTLREVKKIWHHVYKKLVKGKRSQEQSILSPNNDITSSLLNLRINSDTDA